MGIEGEGVQVAAGQARRAVPPPGATVLADEKALSVGRRIQRSRGRIACEAVDVDAAEARRDETPREPSVFAHEQPQMGAGKDASLPWHDLQDVEVSAPAGDDAEGIDLARIDALAGYDGASGGTVVRECGTDGKRRKEDQHRGDFQQKATRKNHDVHQTRE
ncbi:MAG: hypothetical protein HYR86_04240, partial [Candidatus Rokubacteria bacterium]|nr:hypothetical protein [Candidatus Rokubacteria bacterium]